MQFLLVLHQMMLVNMTLDVSGVKFGDFIGLAAIKWHSRDEVGNIGILVF